MKKPIVAFTLSFLLPGAGLAYLGKWKWALINLGIVLLVGVAAAFLFSEQTLHQYGHYIAIGCSGGSGGLAQALTTQMNQQGKTDGVA
jgi:hypothetical protein